MCSSVVIVHTTVQPVLKGACTPVPSQMPIHSASNFLTSSQCGFQSPLICNHGQQVAVKLSDSTLVLLATDHQRCGMLHDCVCACLCTSVGVCMGAQKIYLCL